MKKSRPPRVIPSFFTHEDRARAQDLFIHVRFRLSAAGLDAITKHAGADHEIAASHPQEESIAFRVHVHKRTGRTGCLTVEYRRGKRPPFPRIGLRSAESVTRALFGECTHVRVTEWSETVRIPIPDEQLKKFEEVSKIPASVMGRPGRITGFETETEDRTYGQSLRITQDAVFVRRWVRDLTAADMADAFLVGPRALNQPPKALQEVATGEQVEVSP